MNADSAVSKSQFLNLSQFSLAWRQFLYTLIEYHLDQCLSTSTVAPLRYDPRSCTYGVIQSQVLDNIDLAALTAKVRDTLLATDQTTLLYPLDQPQCIFLDQKPRFSNNTFFYNPYKSLCLLTPQLKTQLAQVLAQVTYSKKSSLLKVLLPKDLAIIGLT